MLRLAVCFCAFLVLVGSTVPPIIGNVKSPSLRSSSIRRQLSCNKNDSPTRVDTTDRLRQLRKRMAEADISAYIITSGDDHQSEYVANHDRRRAFISGFSGSAGTAVVTLKSAALWTDSRYYLQAENQLDCNWVLMESQSADVPTIEGWLATQLNEGDVISADPRIIPHVTWTKWSDYFTKVGLRLETHLDNLVDMIWKEDRPPYPSDPVFVLDTKYAGFTWKEKMNSIRESMAANKASVLILTALDEIAWFLNLRGADIPYTPVFRAYLVVGTDWTTLYLPHGKSTPEVRAHLNCNDHNGMHTIKIKSYESIWEDLPQVLLPNDTVWLPYPYSYAGGVSHLIFEQVPEGRALLLPSPALLLKATKNSVEAQGMQNAHIRDAVALCQFLKILEQGIEAGEIWDELSSAEILKQLRSKQRHSLGPSFTTIAAFGPNAALPHYDPTPETNRVIDDTNVFMLDSGGQYMDGTTDVTRTVHFGQPTEVQRTVYTSLLMGCIDLVSATFPEGQTMSSLEILIREPLYHLGLNYGHGSTHGIGSCLGVHEAFNTTYSENFFGSQEPGYYRANDFGMRLENIVTVVKDNITMENDVNYLTFKPVTLVPYDMKLVNLELLSKREIQWLNDYHARVRKEVGQEMLHQGLYDTYKWLESKTQPVKM